MKKIVIIMVLILLGFISVFSLVAKKREEKIKEAEAIGELLSEYRGRYSGFVGGSGMMAEMVITDEMDVLINYVRGRSMSSISGTLKYESGKVILHETFGARYPIYRLWKDKSGKGYHLKLSVDGVSLTLNYMGPIIKHKPKPVRPEREPLSQKRRELTGGPMKLTVVKGSDNPDHYPTLAEAVNSSRSGDTIYLTEGHYRGPVRLKSNQVLMGDSTLPTIDGENDGWVVAADDSSQISSLTIINSGSSQGITDCGVLIRNVNSVYVKRCKLINNGHYGVVLNHTSGSVIEGCDISDNRILGIYVHRNVKAKVLNNTISNHPVYGIDFVHSNIEMEIRGNIFLFNKLQGICNMAGSRGYFKVSVMDNHFEENGVAIYSDYEELESVKRNTFVSNIENISEISDKYKDEFLRNNTIKEPYSTDG